MSLYVTHEAWQFWTIDTSLESLLMYWQSSHNSLKDLMIASLAAPQMITSMAFQLPDNIETIYIPVLCFQLPDNIETIYIYIYTHAMLSAPR